MPRSLWIALFALLLAAPARAQFTLSVPDTARVLTVSGLGRASADADRAVLRIAFETEGETIDEAIQKHEQEVARVQALLKASGVADDDIKLERASVGPAGGGMRYESLRPGDSEQTFTASRILVVGVDDLDSVPRLMGEIVRNDDDDLLDIQRRNVDVRYTLQAPEALEEEALRMAVAKARERAEMIAEMAGVQLGDVTSVSEGGGSLFGMDPRAAAMMNDNGSGLTDGEYVVTSAVVVTFRIR